MKTTGLFTSGVQALIFATLAAASLFLFCVLSIKWHFQ